MKQQKLKIEPQKLILIIVICVAIILALGIWAIVLATMSDEGRLEYELSANGNYYVVTDIKNNYRDGWFCNDTLTVPSEHKGLPVKQIKKLNTSGIKKIVISEGISSIADKAFQGDGALQEVSLPSSLTKIGSGVFANCNELISIVIQDGGKTYRSENNCIIEIDTKKIIAGCKTSIIPTDGSVEIIGKAAFNGCKGFTTMTIADGIKTIEANAFKDCVNLSSVTIADSVSSIEQNAFSSCIALTSIKLPESLTTISMDAFSSCKELTSVSIPASVTKIEANAFFNCRKLKVVHYGGTMEEWNAITVGKDWNKNMGAQRTSEEDTVDYTVICSDGNIEKK